MSPTDNRTGQWFGTAESGLVPIPGVAANPIGDLPQGSVARQLFEQPWKFDFFEAVLLLQELAENTQRTASAPIAGFSLPCEEALRFCVPNNSVFPAAAIQAIQWDKTQQRASVSINFMGLTGPSGTLPRTYTERLQRIEMVPKHAERHALRDWLDNFNHRLASLFFAAWTKYRFPISIRRQLNEPQVTKNRPSIIHVALSSIGGLVLRDESESKDSQTRSQVAGEGPTKMKRDELLGLAGVLAQRPMNASNLQSALQQCLGVPIKVKQFSGTWLGLEECSQTQLGVRNARLGEEAVVGERIWTRQQKISISVGPLERDEFVQFLPPTDENSGRGLQRLADLVGICIGHTLEFDVQPILKMDQPLAVQLSSDATATRLGYDSWLGTPVGAAFAADAIFPGEATA